MKSLFIIGNGFDIQSKLNTKYKDFYENHHQRLDEHLSYFPAFFADPQWSNFEENLGEFIGDEFAQSVAIKPSLSQLVDSPNLAYGYNDEISNEARHLVGNIRECFELWIRTVDVTQGDKVMDFPDSCKFITFNYTKTLQRLYAIPDHNVLHIHGDVDRNIIFGHNKITDIAHNENAPWFDESIEAISSVTKKFHKNVHQILENHKTTIDGYGVFSKIIVIGHSINNIDAPYFKYLLSRHPNTTWENWNYHNQVQATHEKLVRIGVDPTKLSSYQSDKLAIHYPLKHR